MSFKLCPICELNYIMDDAPMCEVCTALRKGKKLNDEILCPICQMNIINANGDMCSECKRESLLEEEPSRGIIYEASDFDEVTIDDNMELPSVEDDSIPEKDFEEISRDFEGDDTYTDEEDDQ